MNSISTLLIHCPDQVGIVAAVTLFLQRFKGNILYLDQYVDNVNNEFFMRIQWEMALDNEDKDEFEEDFQAEIGSRFRMTWELYYGNGTPKMAVFVSKESHCLYDILARATNGEWQVDIPCIIGNHESLSKAASRFNIPFYHIDVKHLGKEEAESRQLDILKKHKVDFIVLAKYMQILSPSFLDKYQNNIINIHHSFLPAFVGAKPYHSAFERGVKIIGATSHYVTEDLDAGPIIEQGVERVSHRDSVAGMKRKGRDLEKLVLSKAIRKHLEHKVLVYGNKTIIFD